MITADFTHCISLEQFYKEIKTTHQNAHGDAYTAHHDEISRLIQTEKLHTYRELGVMQGATAACAAVSGVKSLHLIDINLSRFLSYEKLFKDQVLILSEKSSVNFTNDSIHDVDILLIDSLHNPDHVRKELDIFHKTTKRHIIFHDTYSIKSIQKMIENWLKEHQEWELKKYYRENVGFTRISRKELT